MNAAVIGQVLGLLPNCSCNWTAWTKIIFKNRMSKCGKAGCFLHEIHIGSLAVPNFKREVFPLNIKFKFEASSLSTC